MRRRRAVQAVLALVAASALLTGPSAAGQSGAGLGGFQGSAGAQGLHTFYFPVGALPTGAVVDFGSPDALATIATGPTTFARAGVADPGDLLANPDALFAAADSRYPQGSIPPWPFRISANSSVGEPERSESPAPGVRSEVRADAGGSSALATSGGSEVPALANVGSMRSEASTVTDGSTVTVTARSEITGFDFAGAIRIESIVTEVRATSDGKTTEVEASTLVSGASIGDQPVIIGRDGVSPDPDSDEPVAPGIGVILDTVGVPALELFEQSGVTITVAEPIETSEDGAASVVAPGVRIDLEISEDTYPIISQLADLAPPIDGPPGFPVGPEDAIAFAEARHLTAYQVGGAEASLAARPGFVFEAPPVVIDTPTAGAPSVGAPVSPGAPAATGGAGAPVPAATPSPIEPPAAPTLQAAPQPISVTTGIGLLAVLGLLVQPLLGSRLAAAASVILASDEAGPCPWEGR